MDVIEIDLGVIIPCRSGCGAFWRDGPGPPFDQERVQLEALAYGWGMISDDGEVYIACPECKTIEADSAKVQDMLDRKRGQT